jgi:hypothetical protein
MNCQTSNGCPAKNFQTEKNCWEIFFLMNNWEKVFGECSNCKVFKLASNKLREERSATI